MLVDTTKLRLLVIDDDRTIPHQVDIILSDIVEKLVIHPETTLMSGIVTFQQVHPLAPYDAVLLDLGLPDSRGLRTLERMREVVRENCAILGMSSLASSPNEFQKIQLGAMEHSRADDFFRKEDLIKPRMLFNAITFAIALSKHRRPARLAESMEISAAEAKAALGQG